MHMNDTVKDILRRVDHTLLSQGATWEEIRAICDDGVKYGCASVCIPASYVRRAAEYVAGKIAICTVIGFPNGYSTTAAKCFDPPIFFLQEPESCLYGLPVNHFCYGFAN